VLPFENLTGDPSQDYLVDGMTDALTSTLAQAGGFHVVSRTSATRYRAAKISLPAIAQELNVDAVLEGSVLRSGQDLRVTAQLIDAATDRHIWARSYEGELGEVRKLQNEIAAAIATALQSRVASLTPARAGITPRVHPDAHDAYVNGVLAMGRQTYEGFRNAVSYFEDAIAREPDFAAAHATLAQAQLQLLYVGPLSPREVIPKAEAAVHRALRLDDTLVQAHRTLGTILSNFYWRWEEGEREFQRARTLAARSNDHSTGGGEAMRLTRAGRIDEAIAQSEAASKQDPRSFNAHVNAATAYRSAGQYDRALARFRHALEIDPASTRGHFQLGVTFVMMGRPADAIGELETAVATSRGNSRFEAYLGYAYAAAGRRADALKILNAHESRARQQYVSSFGIALIHDALGQKEPALTALERAYEDHAVEFAQMTQYPPFKTIASEPRYKALMQRIGLPR
jgi:TolB-like protein/Tfp pilus assembly protein PilF